MSYLIAILAYLLVLTGIGDLQIAAGADGGGFLRGWPVAVAVDSGLHDAGGLDRHRLDRGQRRHDVQDRSGRPDPAHRQRHRHDAADAGSPRGPAATRSIPSRRSSAPATGQTARLLAVLALVIAYMVIVSYQFNALGAVLNAILTDKAGNPLISEGIGTIIAAVCYHHLYDPRRASQSRLYGYRHRDHHHSYVADRAACPVDQSGRLERHGDPFCRDGQTRAHEALGRLHQSPGHQLHAADLPADHGRRQPVSAVLREQKRQGRQERRHVHDLRRAADREPDHPGGLDCLQPDA